MTKFWFFLFLLHKVTARKLTKEENEELKRKCSIKPSEHLRVKRRQSVSNSEYPFAATLCHRIVHLTSGEEVERCTELTCNGVLISRRHILTAAHCLYTFNTLCTGLPPGYQLPRCSSQDVGIFLSSNCTNRKCWSNEKIYKPISLVIHPSYEGCVRNSIYDIGVIELNEDVDIVPICMPEADSVISEQVKLEFIGYRKVDGGYALQSRYQHIEEGEDIVYNMTLENDIAESGGALVQKVAGKHYLFGILAGYGYKIHHKGELAIPLKGVCTFIFNQPFGNDDFPVMTTTEVYTRVGSWHQAKFCAIFLLMILTMV